jgi:hypothetical protein
MEGQINDFIDLNQSLRERYSMTMALQPGTFVSHHLYKDGLKRELSESDYLKLKGQLEGSLQVELGIIRDVCDGTKHLHLDRPHTQVSDSGMRHGAFSKPLVAHSTSVGCSLRFTMVQKFTLTMSLIRC